jgi:hypothetical protein
MLMLSQFWFRVPFLRLCIVCAPIMAWIKPDPLR